MVSGRRRCRRFPELGQERVRRVDPVPFLKPRLTGKRFTGGIIPLEFLTDFTALGELVVETAKWKFRETNDGRTRVPRGFTEGVSLTLTGVEGGSAVPVIGLWVAATTLFASPAQTYFEEAREAIVAAVAAAPGGQDRATDYLPPRLLSYFDRFGRHLRDGETVEFPRRPGERPAILTKQTRRALVLASSAEAVTEEATIFGTIPEVDQEARTFHIRLADGTKAKAPLTGQNYDDVMKASLAYRKRQWVRIAGVCQYTEGGRLRGIETVQHLSLLDRLDVNVRVEELKLLRPGWLEGSGVVPDRAGLDWLAVALGEFYPDDLPLPHLYPTVEGLVRAEWSMDGSEASLEIDLASHRAAWHSLNLDDDTEQTADLLLDNGGWKELAAVVRRAGGFA